MSEPADILIVAIDGPAGAGKSTVGRAVAKKLDLEYLDTGAMYRSVTFGALRRGVDPTNTDAVGALSEQIDIVIEGDLVIVDGHGYAHPKNFGLACHLGLWLNIPTFGIAKKKLVGEYKEPLDEKGNYSYLKYRDEVVGVVLRTKNVTKPVFISAGHLMDINSALNITEKLLDGYRIPYPTRIADRIVAHYKKEQIGNHGGEIQKPAK